MTWHAKPSGSYGFNTTENYDNSTEMKDILVSQGFNIAAVAGVCGNSQHESGLNPWRWQGDSVGSHRGYGLLQWTPSTGYTSLSGATPNFSVTEVTSGATPEDGARQMRAFYENNPAKWVSSCWRSKYWSKTTYAEYWARCQYIMQTWGSGTSISLEQYKTIDDPEYAADCFLACFEGPLVPNYSVREASANDFFQRFGGTVSGFPIRINIDGNGYAFANFHLHDETTRIYRAEAGSYVFIHARPYDEDTFINWTVDYGGISIDYDEGENTFFTMPANNVEITAHFTGETPPEPGPPGYQPYKRKHMPIWMYPCLRA